MPGPNTSKLLQPHSERNFYRVLRALLYGLHRRQANIVGQAEAALLVTEGSRLGRHFSNADEYANLRTNLQELLQTCGELYQYTRSYYSKYLGHEEDFSPYDGAVWDDLFEEIADGIITRTRTIQQQVEMLEIPELRFLSDSENAALGRWRQTLEETKSEMMRWLPEVECLADTAYLEEWLPRNVV